MNSSDTRVQTYLDDLARMLTDLDPGERDDVLAGIREHLDATLAEHRDDPRAVDAALLRLGPPERVAAEARSGQQGPAPHPVMPGPYSPAPLSHPLRTRVAALVCLATVGVPALVALSGLALTLGPEGGAGWPTSSPLAPHPIEVMVLLFPVWLVALVVVLVARELSTRTKWFLAAIGPATSFVIAAATRVDPTATIANLGIGGLMCICALVAVLVWNVVTGREVWRETRP